MEESKKETKGEVKSTRILSKKKKKKEEKKGFKKWSLGFDGEDKVCDFKKGKKGKKGLFHFLAFLGLCMWKAYPTFV